MKKLIALLLVLGVFATTVTITGCGGTTGSPTKKTDGGEKPKTDTGKP